MEQTDDIVERLVAWSHDERLGDGMLLRNAAAEIDRLRARLAEAREMLAKCRGEIEYQDGLLSQLVPVDGPMRNSPHPALEDIDALLAAMEEP